jgi:ATP phosphoribosyltransferase regulatory subunit
VIPEGMRDILPPESGLRRAVEAVLRGRFEAYGYGEVITPTLELAETLEVADDDTLRAGYRLWDDQGRPLMVRTDMTVPVARVAASRFSDEPLPLRFFYVAPAIRPWAPQRGQDGEFVQAGVELLGLRSAAADAEVVALLCDALGAVGLRDFRVSLGTMAYHRALVDSLHLDAADAGKLLEALADRDYPLLESIAGKSDLGDAARKALQRSLELSGTRDSLVQARKLATSVAMERAIEYLVSVHDLVEEAGFGDVLTFNLGLFQDLTYYSDLVFEAYAPGVGLPIASGGRYDGLLARFDWDIPAVGFAIGLDRLEEALDEAGALPPPSAPPLPFVGGLEQPAHAAELRRLGWAVSALPEDADTDERPCVYRRGTTFWVDLPDGSGASGGWRDVLRVLERPARRA